MLGAHTIWRPGPGRVACWVCSPECVIFATLVVLAVVCLYAAGEKLWRKWFAPCIVTGEVQP